MSAPRAREQLPQPGITRAICNRDVPHCRPDQCQRPHLGPPQQILRFLGLELALALAPDQRISWSGSLRDQAAVGSALY
jgi:hypothetical protein